MNHDQTIVIHSMLGRRQVSLALDCLASLQAFVRQPIQFLIHDDGTLDDPARESLTETLRKCVFLTRQEAADRVAEKLNRHPLCAKFREEHLFGIKLFDVGLLAARRAIYCDTDILFTRPLECPSYFQESSHPMTVMQDLKESYSVRLAQWPILHSHGIRLASRVCAGMISYDPVVLDLDYIEWLLGIAAATGLFQGFPFWAEQTIYAALGARSGCAWIDPKECVVAHRSNIQRTRSAAIIHFAGFSRRHFPAIHRTIDLTSNATPQLLGVVRAPDCTLAHRVLSAARSRLFLREDALDLAVR